MRRAALAPALAAALVLVLSSRSPARQSPPPAPAPGIPLEMVIAVINNQPITMRDVEVKVRAFLIANPDLEPEDQSQARKLWQEMLTSEIRERLMRRIASKEELGEMAVERDRQLRLERERLGGEAEFRDVLASKGISEEEFLRTWEEQKQVERVTRRYFLGGVTAEGKRERPSVDLNVSPSEIVAYYRTNPEEFTIRAAARVRQIYLSNSRHEGADAARELAESIRRRVLEGEDFQELASSFDDLASRRERGDLGWVELEAEQSEFSEEIVAFARHARQREVSEVLTNEVGAYLLWIEEKREGRKIPFAEVQGEIRAELWNRKAERYQNRMYRRLLDEAVIYPDDLARMLRR